MTTKRMNIMGVLAAAVLILGVFITPSQAANNWWGCGNGGWSIGSCWSEGIAPQPGDSVFLNNAGGYTVTYTSSTNPSLVGLYVAEDMTLAQGQDTLSSVYQHIGYISTGTFTQTGGTNTNSEIYIGSSGGVGTYNLSGTGSLSSSNQQYVGYYGTGTFNQTGGTNTVNNYLNYLAIGYGNTDYGTYNLSGTGTLSTYDEYVGVSGTGTFTQTSGTNTVSNNLIIGYNSTGVGTYNLSGTGSLSSNSQYIGYYGTGTFNQTGGTNTVTNSVGNYGTYNMQGGTLSAGSMGNLGTFTQTGGTSTVTNSGNYNTYNMQGGTLNADSMDNNGEFSFTGGTLNVTNDFTNWGALTGNSSLGSFNANVVNYGTVSPGLSPGMLTINGNYTQDEYAMLLIELMGYTQGSEYDFLAITGTAALSGILDIGLLNDFSPVLGDTFTILNADSGIFGTFSSYNLPSLNNGLGWQVNYGVNDVTLAVVPEPVSSILFLMGGTLLGGRSLLKRGKGFISK